MTFIATSRGSGGSARTRLEGAITIISTATTEAPTTSPTMNGNTPWDRSEWQHGAVYGSEPQSHHSPEWWNGRHDGLKIRCSQGREGSNPSSGTTVDQGLFRDSHW